MVSKTPKNQKTYSLPLPVAEWLRQFYEKNKEDLQLLGISNETRLLEVLARNGEIFVQDLLEELKQRRKARSNPQE